MVKWRQCKAEGCSVQLCRQEGKHHTKACKSSWSRPGSQKSLTLTIPGIWQSLRRPNVESLHIKPFTAQTQMGLLREQHAELEKGHLRYCCNQDRTKIGWRIPWNVTATCETFRTDCLMEKHHTTGVLVNHSKEPIVPFGSLVEHHPLSTTDQSRIHQIGEDVLPGIFHGCV